MVVERNIGRRERLLRAALAVAFAALAAWAYWRGNTPLAAVATGCAVAFGANAVTCFCVVHRALGIDTTGD